MGRSEIARLATAAGFAAIADALAELACPSLRIECAPASPAVGGTKLGGMPDLPVGTSWPTTAWEGYEPEPMAFFAQIALTELDPEVWPGPRDGLLSFFCRQDPEYYGVDGADAARVLHSGADAELSRPQRPQGLGEDFVFTPFLATLRPEWTLPTIAVHPAEVLVPLGFGLEGPRSAQEDAYAVLQQRLAQEQGFAHRRADGGWAVQHRLLGWPRHVQGDVLPELVLMHFEGEDLDYEEGDLERHSEGWRLLLQIEADNRMGTSFGDGGALYFGLPADDLSAGRFDRVQAITQSG